MLPQNQSEADGDEEKRTGLFECRVSRLMSFPAMRWAAGGGHPARMARRARMRRLEGSAGGGWWVVGGGGLDRVRKKACEEGRSRKEQAGAKRMGRLVPSDLSG